MENINIEKIMDEIRAEIKAKGLKDEEVDFENIMLLGGGTGAPFDMRAYKAELENASENSEVLSYRELSGNPIAKIIKKINRRLIAFYIESIVDDQNKYNRNIKNMMMMNVSKFTEDDNKTAILEKKLYDCERRIKLLEEKLAEK